MQVLVITVITVNTFVDNISKYVVAMAVSHPAINMAHTRHP